MLIGPFQIYNLTKILVKSKSISKHALKILKKTDIHEIMDPSREDITPAAYSLSQNAQPTTASVEISLSINFDRC